MMGYGCGLVVAAARKISDHKEVHEDFCKEATNSKKGELEDVIEFKLFR